MSALPVTIIMSSTIVLLISALLIFRKQTQDSERRAIKAETTDSLTGLYNRSHLETLFNSYVKEAKNTERSFVLLHFNLDGFKRINDTYEHKTGDLILKTVSDRLSEWLERKGDAVRIGGDEFIVLTRLRDGNHSKNAKLVAEQLLDAIEEPIIDNDHTYRVSVSIGGCCYGEPHDNLHCMLNEADLLMYAAKHAGGNRISFSKSKKISVKKQISKNPEKSETSIIPHSNLFERNQNSLLE